MRSVDVNWNGFYYTNRPLVSPSLNSGDLEPNQR